MGPGCWSLESYLLTPPLNQVKNVSSSFLFTFLHVSFFERSLNTGNTDVNCSGKGSVMKFTPSLITNRFLKVAILHVSRDVQGRKKILKRVVVAVYCLKALSTWLKLFVAALLLSQLWVAEYIILTIFISILSSSWYRNPTCSSHVNYHHQLLNLILLNNSLHHNITQPPVNKMPRVCALIDDTSPIPKYFKPRRTRSTTSGHCRAGCGG